MNIRRSIPIAIFCIAILVAVAVGVSVNSDAGDGKVTVTYNSNGSSVAANQGVDIIKTFTYDLHSTVQLKVYADVKSWTWGPTISDSAFLGWATEHNGPVVYSMTDGDVYLQNLDSDLKLYAVWGKVNVTVHQPTEYGTIKVMKYNETSYNVPPVTFPIVTCTELSLKFVPKGSDTVNYWVINGEKMYSGQSEISITVNGITEISLFVTGQDTDIYVLSNGFQAVEYIQNTTGAVINTGVNPDYSTRTEAVFMTACSSYNATSALFGCRANWLKNTYAFWERTADATSMRSDYGVMSDNVMKILGYGYTYHVVKDGRYTTVTSGNGNGEDTMPEVEFYTPGSMYIFCVAEGTKVIGPSMPIRLYSFTIEENGIVSRNFIPCIYNGESDAYMDSRGMPIKNGDVGLYDTVYGTFYRNVGASGTSFTAGPEVHTIGFNGDGGVGAQGVITYTSLESLGSRTVSVPVHPGGYVFCGYYISENPQSYSTLVFDADGSYVDGSLTAVSNYVLIAKWQPVCVKYYENRDRQMSKDVLYQETSLPSTQKFTIPVAPSAPSAGYEFICWSDSAENSYLPGETVYFYEDKDLYAVWKLVDERLVTYNYNDELGRSFKVVGHDVETTIAAGPIREGYVFEYWNTSPDNTGTIYMAGSTHVFSEDMVLFAQWSYHVILDMNGGTGTTSELDFTGHTLPVISVPVKVGATFYGYFDSDGTMYYDSEGNGLHEWDLPTGTVLYAMWTYTVTLEMEGCSFASTPEGWTLSEGVYTKSYTGYGSAYISVPSEIPLVAAGKIFAGWDSEAGHTASGGSLNILCDTEFTVTQVSVSYTALLER